MKITRATFKSFIQKNIDNLYINNKSSFDGMVDCVMLINNGWRKATQTNEENKYTLGINGIWLVGDSRDCFAEYKDEYFTGIEVYNCCGNFILGHNLIK